MEISSIEKDRMLENIIESSKRSRFSAISSQPTKEKIKWKHELMDWGSRS